MKSSKKSFEEQLQRLQEIIDILDDDATPIEEMMKVYEEGINLTKILKDFLNNAELKVIEIGKEIDNAKDENVLV